MVRQLPVAFRIQGVTTSAAASAMPPRPTIRPLARDISRRGCHCCVSMGRAGPRMEDVSPTISRARKNIQNDLAAPCAAVAAAPTMMEKPNSRTGCDLPMRTLTGIVVATNPRPSDAPSQPACVSERWSESLMAGSSKPKESATRVNAELLMTTAASTTQRYEERGAPESVVSTGPGTSEEGAERERSSACIEGLQYRAIGRLKACLGMERRARYHGRS